MADKKAWPHTDDERDSHVRGYEQEVLAAQNRVAELEAMGHGDSPAAEEARQRIKIAKDWLKKLGVGENKAEKRPAGRSKQTR